jgi:hypothetical protein
MVKKRVRMSEARRREQESDEEPGEGSEGEANDAEVLFDVEELNIEWSEWLPWVDYVRTVREAKTGQMIVRRMIAGVRRPGSRLRTTALSTRAGEPVTRVDMHPDGWRELAERAADGDRYRRLVAQGVIKPGKKGKVGRASRTHVLYSASPATLIFGIRMPE